MNSSIMLRIRVREHFVMSTWKNHGSHHVTVLDNPLTLSLPLVTTSFGWNSLLKPVEQDFIFRSKEFMSVWPICCVFSEPSSGPSECYHQQWATWGLHPYWPRRYCAPTSCGCFPTEAGQSSNMASLYWCPRVCIPQHQVHRRVSCWWAYQCCQGDLLP